MKPKVGLEGLSLDGKEKGSIKVLLEDLKPQCSRFDSLVSAPVGGKIGGIQTFSEQPLVPVLSFTHPRWRHVGDAVVFHNR